MGHRFEVFSRNFDAVREHNSINERFTMGINQFSDMTVEEFSELYGTQGLKPKEKKDKAATRPNLRAIN
jgi:hypothetical protein